MSTRASDERSTRPLLTLGRVDLIRIQVGFRRGPEAPAHHQFLLDAPVAEAEVGDVLDEARLLAALEPVVSANGDVPLHYSLHQHRSHTSWGPSPGAVDIGLLVTTGTRKAAVAAASIERVAEAFRDVLTVVGRPAPAPVSHEAAVARARRSTATAYAVDPDALSVSVAEHRAVDGTWSVGLRSGTSERYDVVIGFVDGYAGSVHVRHDDRVEVLDSVGSE